MHSSDFSDSAGHLTFALVLVPGVDTVLHAVAHQSVVDAHVAVTEERVCFARSWRDTWKIRVNFNFISVKIYFPKMLSSTFHSDGIIMIKLMLGCPRMPGNTFGLESGLLLQPKPSVFHEFSSSSSSSNTCRVVEMTESCLFKQPIRDAHKKQFKDDVKQNFTGQKHCNTMTRTNLG